MKHISPSRRFERENDGDVVLSALIIVLFLVRGCRPGKSVSMSEQEVRGLCLKSREIFLQQPILLELEAPLKICGMYLRCPYLTFWILLGRVRINMTRTLWPKTLLFVCRWNHEKLEYDTVFHMFFYLKVCFIGRRILYYRGRTFWFIFLYFFVKNIFIKNFVFPVCEQSPRNRNGHEQ